MSWLATLVLVLGLAFGCQAACPCPFSPVNIVAGGVQTLNSPNWQNPYPAGCQCSIKVQTAQGYGVQFSFQFFFTSAGDNLTITDGNGNLIRSCSGVGCANVNSTTHNAIVRFNSQSSNVGFSIVMQSYQEASCNCSPIVRFTNSMLTLQSPGAGNGGFHGRCECEWYLGVPMNNRIDFQLTQQSNLNTLTLYSGNRTFNFLRNCIDSDCSNVLVFNNWLTVHYLSFQSNTAFTAKIIKRTIKPCDKNPCLNGANCTNVGTTDYKCNCPFGFTGKTCSLPACFFTITNSGSYILQVSYSSSQGAASFTLLNGRQNFFTAVADTYITLHAYLGSTTRLYVNQCSYPGPRTRNIVCSGTSLVGFKCTSAPMNAVESAATFAKAQSLNLNAVPAKIIEGPMEEEEQVKGAHLPQIPRFPVFKLHP